MAHAAEGVGCGKDMAGTDEAGGDFGKNIVIAEKTVIGKENGFDCTILGEEAVFWKRAERISNNGCNRWIY